MKTIIHDAYVALLSGLTDYKPNTEEIVWEDKYRNEITVEIIDAKRELCVVRYYHRNGNVCQKLNFKNGQSCGERLTYRRNGSLSWKEMFKNDHQHGKQTQYDENGNLLWEGNYKNGIYLGEGDNFVTITP